jgi:hypothetical protein
MTMKMKATFFNPNGIDQVYEDEQAWLMLEQAKPYKGVPKLAQLPRFKKTYKGKNAAGGIKATFSTPLGYKAKRKHPIFGVYLTPVPGSGISPWGEDVKTDND